MERTGTSREEHMTKRLVTHEDWEHGEHYGNRNIYHETKMDERNVKWIPDSSQLT